MSDLVNRWIQTRLGIVTNWTVETFCNKTRDGYLLCQILRSYEIIHEDQLNLIEKSESRQVCLENFKTYIVNWLKLIDIYLGNEEVEGIVDCVGLTSLNLFYKLFLELHEKDNLTFVTQQRLNEKLRPTNGRFTVTKVKPSLLENIPSMSDKYAAPLNDCYDVIHWHQDRLETLINKCKSAREEYTSLSKIKQRRLSSNYSVELSYPTLEPLKKEVKKEDTHFDSVKSIDLSYDELIEEQNKLKGLEKFEPNILESNKILGKYKAKIQKQAENSVFKKQLQKSLLNTFWNKINSDESLETSKDLTEKLLKQSLYEKQMLRKLGEIKQQRESMIQNKQAISDAIMKEKEVEFVEKLLQKEKDLNEKELEYYLEKEKDYQLHKRIYNEKLRLKSERCNKMCKDIVKDICNVALKLSEYKEQFGEEPPRNVIDTWKKLFITAQSLENLVTPLEDILKTDDLTEEMETIVHHEIERQEKLDEKDFESYQNFEWPWELCNIKVEEDLLQDMIRGENVLGYIVHVLLEAKYPYPTPPIPPNLPKVNVAVCVNGISDISCLRPLRKLLKHKEIVVIEMQDVINFCLSAFKNETKVDDEAGLPSESVTKKKNKSRSDLKLKKGAKPGSEYFGKKSEQKQDTIEMSDKAIQTPKKYPGEEIHLTTKAELGKVADEELSYGRPLTDYLLIDMFIEFLKAIPDMRGWALINYPSTFEQAILLEEALTGVSVPNIYKVSRNEGKNKDLELDCGETLDENEEMRNSKLVKNPIEKKELPFFDSALTAYIKMYESGDDEVTSDSDMSRNPEEFETDFSPLEKFYCDMGNNYSMYFKNFDFDTVKHLAKLIIGDYSIPPKSSIELFGDGLRYTSIDKGVKGFVETAKSIKRGMKKEPDRIEKVVKNKEAISEIDKVIPEPKREKLGKKGKKDKSDLVIIVHEDKFTQIPEIIYEEVEEEQETRIAEPGEPGWEYIRIKLPEEFQISLAGIWENTETVYIRDFNQVMFMQRLILNPIMPAVKFLEDFMKINTDKPDDKQLYLRKFQQTYNEFDDEIRSDEEFKAELHCRVDEMREKLIEVCDRKMMETEQQRCFFLKRGWAPKQLIELMNNYVNALQLEIDRHADTFIFLNDYYTGLLTKMPNDDIITKEILARYEIEDPEINESVINLLENVESDGNPLSDKIDQIFNKVLIITNKFDTWTWSVFESKKAKLDPNGEKGKIAKKEKKNKTGEKSNFEPDEAVKKILGPLFDEWACALKGEIARVMIRINLLKFDAKQNIDRILNSMKKAAHSAFENIRSKYWEDINNINEACNFLSRAIEMECAIQEELIFSGSHFHVNANVIYFPDPPPTQKLGAETERDLSFTISQLETLTDILFDLAPSGYIPERSFIYLLQDMIADEEKSMAPKAWKKLSTKKMEQLSEEIFGNNQSIQWRQFILYNLMIPFPSVEELLNLRKHLTEHDINFTEVISEEQFEEITLWFETSGDVQQQVVRNLLLKLYKISYENFNYTAMLFDFCKGSSTPEGFAKALALSSGKALCWDERVGEMFVKDILEKRRIHEEEVTIRNEERKQAEDFVKIIIDESIGETVHKCESIIIEEVKHETNSFRKIRTNEKVRVKIVSESEGTDENPDELNHDKFEESDNNDHGEKSDLGGDLEEESKGNLSNESGKLESNDDKKFFNIEIGFECNPNPNLQYFIELETVLSVLSIVLSWSFNVQNIEDKSFCELLQEIYDECKNPQFNDEVLSHEFLNNPKFLKLLSNTTIFLVKNPSEIVKELLDE
ncbi:sperm flagellar protein 2 [Leptinotarsa decemlineata]|uniref:sperm flagellar protein 2 n=1 Tax=Leptinotarsa decemlineata TaxID=7539 RepID=UPI003D304929